MIVAIVRSDNTAARMIDGEELDEVGVLSLANPVSGTPGVLMFVLSHPAKRVRFAEIGVEKSQADPFMGASFQRVNK